MGVIQVQLPEQLQQVIDREVAEGRIASRSAFLIKAAQRFAEEIALEDEIAVEAAAGIADAEAGRYRTVATATDAAELHVAAMDRLRARLAAPLDE
jgi:Arc/MetJ-type ribon-helix-helix transcriptional regulator